MLKEINIPIKNSFNIWFNKEKKKEFYTTTLIMHKIEFNNNHINNFYSITPQPNLPSKEIYFSTANFQTPIEENYGIFLIRFLNANFSSFEKAYSTFFCFYGFSILQEFYKEIPQPRLFKTEKDFFDTYEPIFNNIKTKLKNLQNLTKKCVNYMYNLNNNDKDKNYSPLEKYLSYSISNNIFKYSTNIDIFYFQLFAHDTFNITSQSVTPKIVREHLANEIINADDSAVFHTAYLSNVLYISLSEIAFNKAVKIKICKNCGKYFIPTKNTEKYCTITYNPDELSCKVNGATNSYLKKRNSVEAIRIYRNEYQRRLMQVKRSNNEQVRLEFEDWKKIAKSKFKNFNNKNILEKDLIHWLTNNQNLK